MMSRTRVDAVFPQEQSAIPEEQSAIPEERSVIPDSILDPVPQHPWIAGAETPDLIRGRNDRLFVTLAQRRREFHKHQ
jgi:hypothetical protein